jgi:Flp pilus assembly protein TadG
MNRHARSSNTRSASPGDKSDRRWGQALVEFSLILPLLLLLIFGIIDFGIAIWKYNTVANIGREIARYGVVHPNEIKDNEGGNFYTFIKDTFGPEEFERWTRGLITNSLNITPTLGGGGLFGTVQVTVTYQHPLLTGPVIQAVGGNPDVDMKTVTSMNLEVPPNN